MDVHAASPTPVVELRALRKVYTPTPAWMRLLVRSAIKADVVALDRVDLELGPGGICAIVGPNGAGKTTMFRILVGLTTPTSGVARVLGMDAEDGSHEVRKVVGFMPAEDRSLFMRLTCSENLYFHGRLQGMNRRELRPRIEEVLDQVGILSRSNSAVVSLSSGMRARLQLARAILHVPRLLILDEPTSTVDPVGAHQLLTLITTLVREGDLAALISSHRLEEIEALHADVLLLDRGLVRHRGDLDALRARWDRPYTEFAFETVASARAAALALAEVAEVTILDPYTIRSLAHNGDNVGRLLHHLGPYVGDVVSVRERPMPLRDLLARVYASEHGDDLSEERVE